MKKKSKMPSLDDMIATSEDNNEAKGNMPSLDKVALPPLGEVPKQEELEIEEIEEISFDDESELETSLIGDVSGDETTDELKGHYDDPMEYDEDLYEDQYRDIDEKNRKVLPLGSKRREEKIKASDVDDRPDMLKSVKVMRFAIIIGLAILFLLGMKNTFFPSHVYSKEDIQAIAQNSIGETGFPKEAGATFAEDFIKTYLTIDPEDAAHKELLAYYYSSNADVGSLSQVNMKQGSKAKQSVVGTPRVYDVMMATNNSAVYKVSALVTNTDGTSTVDGKNNTRWLAFAVNVYFDEDTERLAVLPNNPTLIPKFEVASSTSIPQGVKIGNGIINNEMIDVLTPTIDGYVKAYAEASVESHNDILQYISKNPDPELYSGFGGSVRLIDSSNAITKEVYDSDIEDEYKVLVEVQWEDNVASKGDNRVEYHSQYVMTINKTSDEKYVVTAFRPYTYVESQDSAE